MRRRRCIKEGEERPDRLGHDPQFQTGRTGAAGPLASARFPCSSGMQAAYRKGYLPFRPPHNSPLGRHFTHTALLCEQGHHTPSNCILQAKLRKMLAGLKKRPHCRALNEKTPKSAARRFTKPGGYGIILFSRPKPAKAALAGGRRRACAEGENSS